MANTQYPEGKPLMRGDIKFSNCSTNFSLSKLPWVLSNKTLRTIDKLKFAGPNYSSNREINSALRFTPNLMKMWRK